MQARTGITMTLGLLPGLLALPVVSLPQAAASPVKPEVSVLAPHGVDARALADLTVDGKVLAQPQDPSAAVVSPRSDAAPVVLTSPAATKDFTVAGVTWDADTSAKDVSVSMRVREDGGWTRWEALPIADEGPDAGTEEYKNARVGTSPLLTGGSDGVQVRVDAADGKAPEDLEVALIDPGESPADAVAGQNARPAASADAAAQPTIITRAQWGADESLSPGTRDVNSTIKAMILHHTAGSNSYSQSQAIQEIRGIYAYHTTNLGWSDIGYNLLVDRYGRLYEGRRGSITAPVQGAHSGGFNADTYGISVMGNFDVASIPQAAVDAVKRATAWKLGQYGVNPNGTARLRSAGGGTSRFPAGTPVTINAISGHRDVGQTACPGRYLYPKLAEIRSYAAAVSPGTAPPPAPAPAPSAGSSGFPRDWNGDGDADMMARDSSARLWSYPGDGRGGFEAPVQIGRGWGSRDLVTQVGDWDGDGDGDVIGRDVALGNLWLYPGDGRGGWQPPRNIGGSWRVVDGLLGPGDFDDDGAVDLLARRRDDGKLWLYPGNGRGGFGTAREVGTDWDGMDLLVAADDWDGDDRPDVIARSSSGDLRFFDGDGRGGFGRAVTIGERWTAVDSLVVTGDWDGSGGSDMLARDQSGRLTLYSGGGTGAIAATHSVGHGWGSFTMIG